MANRHLHYDAAFEHYLRANGIPYVAVNEARKALDGPSARLKSFDFVVYGSQQANWLVDVKGRKHSGRSHRHLDNWVSQEDIDGLLRWEQVFGGGFRGALVFLYWCQVQPPDALFLETFAFRDRWYAVLAVPVAQYRRHMTCRSPRWQTVHVSAAAFARISRPLQEML